MALLIRTMKLADLTAVDAIFVAAYQTQESRAVEFRRYLGLQPDGWFLAVEDDEPVGIGGVVDYGPFAYIGLIGVLPAAQRRGIGRVIMDHILTWLASRGTPLALLDASTAGAPLYTQLGFVIDDQSEIWRRETNIPIVATQQHVAPVPITDLAALAAYDRMHFQADRTLMLAAFLREFPNRVLATHADDGRITGYLIAQPHTLGPWMADAAISAEALLHHALMLPFTGAPTVLVPAAHGAACDLMQRMGFVKQRTLQHMRRGAQPRQRPGTYGLASFTLG